MKEITVVQYLALVCECAASAGCSFRHFDEQHLWQMLVAHSLPQKGVAQVTSHMKEQYYQLPCQKYFEITHWVYNTSAVIVVNVVLCD